MMMSGERIRPKQTSESEIKTKTVSRNRFSETGIFLPGFIVLIGYQGSTLICVG